MFKYNVYTYNKIVISSSLSSPLEIWRHFILAWTIW